MNPFEQIFYNIVGGGLVSLLTFLGIKILDFFRSRRFKKVFGFDSENSYFIVYGLMKLAPSFDDKGILIQWPYTKPDVNGKFNISTPVSAAEMRGAKYLSEAFGKNAKTSPVLIPDLEIRDKMDISFCSVGGLNNLKTIDILECEDNNFFTFASSPQITISVKSEPSMKFAVDGYFDYGFIIKLRPKSLQNKVWIGIAGLGEWGTSGAAWFLARNWKDIEKNYRNKPFGIIVKVRGGKDESAQLVYQTSGGR